jgi:hypothetical protein
MRLQERGFEKVGHFVLADADCVKLESERPEPESSTGGWVYAWLATKEDVKYVGKTTEPNLFDRFKRDRKGCYHPNRARLLSYIIGELERSNEVELWAISEEKIRQNATHKNLDSFEEYLIRELSPEWNRSLKPRRVRFKAPRLRDS